MATSNSTSPETKSPETNPGLMYRAEQLRDLFGAIRRIANAQDEEDPDPEIAYETACLAEIGFKEAESLRNALDQESIDRIGALLEAGNPDSQPR